MKLCAEPLLQILLNGLATFEDASWCDPDPEAEARVAAFFARMMRPPGR